MRTIVGILVLAGVTVAAAACGSARDEAPVAPPAPPVSPPGPQPQFGPLIQAAEAPPPITGGTLAVAPELSLAVAADPDRDKIYVIDIAGRAVTHVVDLPAHAEPGRVAVDDLGHAYVVLRRAGGVAEVDLASGALTMREACSTPRGVAYDKLAGAIQVTCATGELLTLPLDRTKPVRRVQVGLDLRDVTVGTGGRLHVTQFRTANTVLLNKQGDIIDQAAGVAQETQNLMWRAVALPDQPDQQATVAQHPKEEAVDPAPGGYGGEGSVSSGVDGFSDPTVSFGSTCEADKGIVTTVLNIGAAPSIHLPEAVVPVDLATNGREFAVVAAGNAYTRSLPQIFVVSPDTVGDGCASIVHGNVPGQAIAAAFDGDDALLVQTREPAAINIMTDDRRRVWKTITLATDSHADTGHAIFHSNAGGFIACASCHAEGAEDGHVWEFVGMGPRRTPSLAGTVAGTEPFHWSGDMANIRELVDHVFVERMNGPKVDDDQLHALKQFLDTIPAPAKLRAADDSAAIRGNAVFQDRCVTCHSGAKMTNNKTVDVGTGGAFQVPSLVGVGWRAPFLHTGCAPTLMDRFTNPDCAGPNHAVTSDLSHDQLVDITAFLETL